MFSLSTGQKVDMKKFLQSTDAELHDLAYTPLSRDKLRECKLVLQDKLQNDKIRKFGGIPGPDTIEELKKLFDSLSLENYLGFFLGKNR